MENQIEVVWNDYVEVYPDWESFGDDRVRQWVEFAHSQRITPSEATSYYFRRIASDPISRHISGL